MLTLTGSEFFHPQELLYKLTVFLFIFSFTPNMAAKRMLTTIFTFLVGLEPLSPPKAVGTETAAEREPKQNVDELDPTCAAATWKIIRDKLPRAQPPDTRL